MRSPSWKWLDSRGGEGKNEEGWHDRIEESVGEDVIVFSDTDIRGEGETKVCKAQPGAAKDSVMIVQSQAKMTVGLNR